MRELKLDSGWLAARSTEMGLSGVELTTTHPPSQPTKLWMEGVVPGTVLGTLLKNKLIGDPFYGLVNEAIIDIADSGREYYTFWFFTRFQAPMSVNTHAWLNFRGINYSADVYLNGHQKTLPKGMFRRHTLDVTDMLHSNGDNFLAVLVYPPDHPGRIPTEGGQGGDHDIGKDVATQYVQGWDWMAPIRDRNTGIWDQVSITFSGPVKISDPHLVSSFFDDLKRVYLHTTAEFTNVSPLAAECTLKLQVALELEDGVCLIEHMETKELSIPGGTSVVYTFSPLFFYRPSLWWPNGLGKQTLYKVDITVDVKGYGESDSWSHPFGFRKIESHIDPATGGRLFKVNGEPVFIRGGNWILSDGLLRLSEKRYKADIKFHADMNFNMIRCWGGGLAERPEFYKYCDQYGLLVWQEFWITGDVDGRGIPVSNPNGPLDHELFLICARDTVKLLRNHASLALWVGGNEQHPPDDINTALKNDLQLHPYFKSSDIGTNLMKAYEDPSRYLDGTRIYIQGSLWDGFAKGNGEFSDGPYEIQNPEDFFKDDFYQYGFNPEVGSVGMPVATTIRATMPPEAWQIPLFQKLSSGYIKEVPNPVWDYHKYIPYSKPGKVHDQIEMYGEPNGLDDFCAKAQLVNYIQYKALLEGWTSRMWTKYTGVLIWKTQNPWTGLRGQFYDHLHDQTAGFYGVRSAAEPIHVQLNLATYFIEIVNTTSSPLSSVTVEASVWDFEGNRPYHKINKNISVPSKKTLPVFEMQYPKSDNPKPVYFLLLKLLDKSNAKVLSRNFYWLHLPGGNYKLLDTYRSKKVPIRSSTQAFLVGKTCTVKIKVHNLSNKSLSECQSHLNFEDRDNQHEPIGIENNCDYGNMNVEEPATEKTEGLLSRVSSLFSGKNKHIQVTETKGDHSGVAFFLNFSVLGASNTNKSDEDKRILPVNYSDNYFSLPPGEVLPVDISFEIPPNTVPKIVLQGWNTNGHHLSMQITKL